MQFGHFPYRFVERERELVKGEYGTDVRVTSLAGVKGHPHQTACLDVTPCFEVLTEAEGGGSYPKMLVRFKSYFSSAEPSCRSRCHAG